MIKSLLFVKNTGSVSVIYTEYVHHQMLFDFFFFFLKCIAEILQDNTIVFFFLFLFDICGKKNETKRFCFMFHAYNSDWHS